MRETLNVHLAECAILRKESLDAQRETRDALKFMGKSAVAVFLALIGWLGVQVFNGIQAQSAADHQAYVSARAFSQSQASAKP